MNADVLIWGPIGSMYRLGRPGQPQLRQQRWRDLPDSELEDAINWVAEEHYNQTVEYPRVYIYTATKYMPAGQTVQLGKNRGGGGTMYHYMIVSDEKIESEEQAEALLQEVLDASKADTQH